MKKIKNLFKLLIFSCLTFLLVSTWFSQSQVEASGKINVKFTVVDYDKYNEVLTKYSGAMADIAQCEGFGANAEMAWTMFGYNTKHASLGSTIAVIKANYASELEGANKNTFGQSSAEETKYFGVIYSVQSDINLINLVIGIQYSLLPSSTGGDETLSDASNNLSLYEKTDITIPTGSKLSKNSYTESVNMITTGNYSTNTDGGMDVSSWTDLIILKVPISTTANGTYTLTMPNIANIKGQFLNGTESTGTSIFNITPATITIEGASTDTTTTFTSGTSTTSATNASVSTGTTTINSTEYKTAKMETIPASYTNAYLKPSVAANGTVKSVKYGTSAQAALTGSVASPSSGCYEIPMSCNTNNSMFAAVSVLASDNTTTETYIVEIPRGKYDVKKLTGLSMSANSTSVDLYQNNSYTGTTGFNASVTDYYIKLKKDMTNLSISPSWDLGYNQSCKVITYTSAGQSEKTHTTNGSAASYTHEDASDITIKMIAEDGSEKNYVIHVYRIKDEVGIGTISAGLSSTNLTTISANSGDPYNYATTVQLGTTAVWVNANIKTDSNSTITMACGDSGVTNKSDFVAGTPYQCTFSNGNGGATMVVEFTVTAEDGTTTQVYTLTITRDSGSKETGLDSVYVSYNGGAVAQATYNSSTKVYSINNLSFTNKTNDYFVFKVNQKTGEAGKQTISYHTLTDPTTEINLINGTLTTTKNYFSDTTVQTITIIITVKAQDTSISPVTYNLEVTRNAASNDTSIKNNGVAVKYNGASQTVTLLSDVYSVSNLGFTSNTNDGFTFAVTQGHANQTIKYKIDGTEYPLNSGIYSSKINFSGYSSETKTITIIIIAEDESTSKEYTLNVTRNGASQNTSINSIVLSYNGSNVTLQNSGDTYSVSNLEFNSKTGDYVKLKVVGAEAGQVITVSNALSGTLTSGSFSQEVYFSQNAEETLTFVITVTASDPAYSKDYTVNATRKAASTAKDIDDFKVYKYNDTNQIELSGSWNGNAYNIPDNIKYADYGTGSMVINKSVKISYSIPAKSKIKIECDNGQIANDENSTSTSKNNTTAEFTFGSITQSTLSFTITVTAQDGSTNVYTTSVTREAANDDISCIGIDAYIDDINQTELTVETSSSIFSNRIIYSNDEAKLPYAVKSLIIKFSSSVNTTRILYQGTDITNTENLSYAIQNNLVATSEITSGCFEFTVVTEANQTGRSIKVYYSRKGANQEKDLDLTNFKLKDDLGNSYDLPTPSAARTYKFLLDSKKGMTEYYIDGISLATSTSLATIYAVEGDSNQYKGHLYDKDVAHQIPSTTYIVVESEAGVAQTYTFEVDFAEVLDSVNKISMITIAEVDISQFEFTELDANSTTDLTWNITVPYSTNKLTISATLASSKAQFAKDDRLKVANSLPVGTTTLYFQGKAQDSSLSPLYTINVTRTEGSQDDYLERLVIGSTTIINSSDSTLEYTRDSSIIHHLVTPGSTNAKLTYVVSNNAIVDIKLTGGTSSNSTSSYSTNIIDGAVNEIVLRITSEKNYYDGNTSNYREYKIYIYPASDELEVDSIDLYKDNTLAEVLVDEDGTPITYDFTKDASVIQEFRIPFASKTAHVDVVIPDRLSNLITINQTSKGSISSAGITYTIVVKSQFAAINTFGLGKTQTYKIKLIQNAASTEKRLSNLEILIVKDGVPTNFIENFDKDIFNYACQEIPTSALTATVKYELYDPVHSKIAAGSDVGSVNIALNNNTQTLKIVVLDENEDKNIYTIILTTGKIEWANNTTITDITVTTANSQDSILNFVETNPNYSNSVRPSVTELYFTVVTATPTATVAINGTTMNSTSSTTIHKLTLPVVSGQKNTYEIQCTAENGTAKSMKYTLDVTSVKADSSSELSTFTINNRPVESGDTLYVSTDVDNVPVLITPNSKYATVSPQITYKDLNYGNNTISFRVTAEDGSFTDYNVTVHRDYPQTLDSIVVYEKNDSSKTNLISFDPATYSYVIPAIPYSYENDTLVIEADSAYISNLKVEGLGDWVLSETGKEYTREIIVTAGSNSSITYTIKASRENGDSDNYITSYKVSSDATEDLSGFSPQFSTIKYVVGVEVNKFEPVIEVSENALVNPNNSNIKYILYDKNNNELLMEKPNLEIGKNEFVIEVISQTHESRKYYITVYRADSDYGFNNINVYTNATDEITVIDTISGNPYDFANFDSVTYTQNINVSYTNSQVYLVFSIKGSNSKVYVNGSEFNKVTGEGGVITYKGLIPLSNKGTTPNVITMYTESELGQYTTEFGPTKTNEYVLNIYRDEANSDATLSKLEVIVNGENKLVGFDPETDTYSIVGIGNVSELTINAEATAGPSKTTITGTGVMQLVQNGGGSEETGYHYSFTIVCTAEDGTVKKYKVSVSRSNMTEAEENSNNVIDKIVVVDSSNNSNNLDLTDETKTYEIHIPYGEKSYTIRVTTQVNKSVVSITGAPEVVNNSCQFSVPTYDSVNGFATPSVTHKVYATSLSGVKGEEYTINIIFDEPNSDNNLSSIIVDSRPINGFDSNITSYDLGTVDNSVEQLIVSAIKSNDLANVDINYGTEDGKLKLGMNTITITVTAQSGAKKYYNITVVRDYPNPYLYDIMVSGSVRLDLYTDDEKNIIAFNKDILSYRAIATYTTDTATITVRIDNSDYSVVMGNATDVKDYGTTFIYTVSLKEGDNPFQINVTSRTSQKTIGYSLIIRKKAAPSSSTNLLSLTIKEIPEFVYIPDTNQYGKFNLASNIGKLTVNYEKEVMNKDEEQKVTVLYADPVSFGDSTVMIIIEAPSGASRIIFIDINRAQYETEISVEDIPDFKYDYSNNNLKDKYTVPYNVKELEFNASFIGAGLENEKVDYQVIGADDLKVGDNEVTIITNINGLQTIEKVIVTREPNQITAIINEIKEFEYDFKADRVDPTKKYNVPNDVKSLNVSLKSLIEEDETIEYQLYGADNLKAGENVVKLTTFVNGVVETKEFIVVRENFKINYNLDATKYNAEIASNKDNTLSIDMKNNKATAREDYRKYIDLVEGMTAEVISNVTDSSEEVVLKVTDGDDIQFVSIRLNNVAKPTEVSWLVWIVLGIAILLLIIILISVNKDKYGKITKKRKSYN